MTDDPAVFQCYDNIHDTIWHSELGASLAILNAGYNLDSLMLRYQVRMRNTPLQYLEQVGAPGIAPADDHLEGHVA